MLSDTLAAIKEVLVLADKVERLGNTLEKMADKVDDQNSRIVRLETMVEIASLQGNKN
ncbi:MAG: hypothetical protein ACR2P1_03590 [Pseudomonadales bacterium]